MLLIIAKKNSSAYKGCFQFLIALSMWFKSKISTFLSIQKSINALI